MADRRRFPVGLTLAALMGLAILCSLGVWQVQRLHWKEDLLARIEALKAAPAQDIERVLARVAAGADADFTRVQAVCKHIDTAPYLELHAIREGQAGVRLISACEVTAGRYRTVLVDRGFVADTISARPRAVEGEQPDPIAVVPVVGVLRRPDPPNFVTPPNEVGANHWYSRDVAAMAAALKAPAPAPLMLLAETSTNPGWKALVPAPLPTEIPNRHLEYALTWFGLAGALLAVYAAMLWRMWKA